jgi:hypothetical protein
LEQKPEKNKNIERERETLNINKGSGKQVGSLTNNQKN